MNLHIKQIENIFSRGKTNEKVEKQKNPCPNPKVRIIIDRREKNSLIASYLVDKKANINFEHLQIADYLVGKTAIERKTFSDFISSMINKRLLNQLTDLKKHPHPLLIIEGFDYNYNPRQFKIHENAIRGMFLSVIIDFQVPIIFSENEEDTADFLISIAKKQEKTKQPISLRPSKTFKNLKQQRQYILEGFPGIGPLTAKKLLKNFQKFIDVFNASEEDLKKILKPSKTQKFRNMLDL
jgi:Fanconi anemia group M protein